MSFVTRLISLLSLLVLGACGGGGGDLAPFGGGASAPTGGGGTPVASDLVIVLSSPTVSNSGTDTVTATITALDANRNALKDVPITVTADNDAIVTFVNGAVTDASGKVTATISIGSNRANRVITMTATSGTISRTATVTVVTGSTQGPTAADITLSLSSPSIPNSGSVTVTATVTAVDANRNVIGGIPVTLSVDSDATIQVSGSTTSSTGVVTGTIRVGANQSNRRITVTAKSGSLQQQAVLQVIGTRISATALPAVLAPSTAGKVQYTVTDSSNGPQAGVDIVVIGPNGAPTAAKTDINGTYEYSYTAPTSAGTFDITASASGINNVTSVIVQAGTGTVPVVPAGSVRSASVRANPSAVAVNAAGQTTNRAEVRALFVGSNNQPIQNVRVRFDLDGDANSVGGNFTSGSVVIYSDANGVALTSYIPGNRFSPTDGVTVRACWDYADFPAGTCPNRTTTTLTVINDALSVTIGTDHLVVLEDLVYVQRFVVQVNDSSGLAKADAQVSPVLDLESYSQGFYDRSTEEWIKFETATECGNEDVNRNGILETYSNGHREDANGNNQLDPRKADVVVSFEGSSRTDNAGIVKLRITYPRNTASWVKYNLTVSAAGVSGTEGRSSFRRLLLAPIDAIKAEAEPPFVVSPYGRTSGQPRSVVTTPDGRSSASLCTQ